MKKKSIAHLRDNKPLKYAQISLCVMDLPQGSDLFSRENIGQSSHQKKTSHRTQQIPTQLQTLTKRGTTACKEGPTTLLRCRGLQDPRSVLRKGTTDLKEGTAGYRRGMAGNNQGGQQQKHFQQRIRHSQHPHNNKQIIAGTWQQDNEEADLSKGSQATVTRRLNKVTRRSRMSIVTRKPQQTHKEAAAMKEKYATSLKRKKMSECRCRGRVLNLYF
jgi:hypothetical protein